MNQVYICFFRCCCCCWFFFNNLQNNTMFTQYDDFYVTFIQNSFQHFKFHTTINTNVVTHIKHQHTHTQTHRNKWNFFPYCLLLWSFHFLLKKIATTNKKKVIWSSYNTITKQIFLIRLLLNINVSIKKKKEINEMMMMIFNSS